MTSNLSRQSSRRRAPDHHSQTRNNQMHQPLTSFRSMTPEDHHLFAQILRSQPEPRVSHDSQWWQQYAKIVKQDIKALPPHLQDKRDWLGHMINKHQHPEDRAHLDVLCPIHDQLNRRLVVSLLHWIQREVDVVIPGCVAPLIKAGLLDRETILKFEALSDISAMWLRETTFTKHLKRSVKPKWKFQRDCCEACIIARFAGHEEIVTMLKAGMIMRSEPTEQGQVSRRMQYVDAMIFELPIDNQRRLWDAAVALGRGLQIVRKNWEASLQKPPDVDPKPNGPRRVPVPVPVPAAPRPTVLKRTNLEDRVLLTPPPLILRKKVESPRGSQPSSNASTGNQTSRSQTPYNATDSPTDKFFDHYKPAQWRTNLHRKPVPQSVEKNAIDTKHRYADAHRAVSPDHSDSYSGETEHKARMSAHASPVADFEYFDYYPMKEPRSLAPDKNQDKMTTINNLAREYRSAPPPPHPNIPESPSSIYSPLSLITATNTGTSSPFFSTPPSKINAHVSDSSRSSIYNSSNSTTPPSALSSSYSPHPLSLRTRLQTTLAPLRTSLTPPQKPRHLPLERACLETLSLSPPPLTPPSPPVLLDFQQIQEHHLQRHQQLQQQPQQKQKPERAESIVSVLSAGSSQYEGNFRWDKVNLRSNLDLGESMTASLTSLALHDAKHEHRN